MLKLRTVYYFPREGRRVTFLGYDEIGLAKVMDADGNEYLCHDTDLQPLTKEQVKMTAAEIVEREG